MDMIHRGELRDPVPEVKNMADAVRPHTEAANHLSNLRLNMRRSTQQDSGIEVSLQGTLMSYPCPGLPEVGGPVQTQGGAARCGGLLEPEPTALHKNNGRQMGVRLGQPLDDFLDIGL